jgi:small-conductance mechanosensitive channel
MATIIESIERMQDAFRLLAYNLGRPRPRTLIETWERKMDPNVFDERGIARRVNRRKKERRNMALLKMIGGLLQVLFWLFVIVGTLAVIGLLFFSPFIALIVVACIAAGIVNALYRRGRES